MPYGQILSDSITDSSGGVLAPSSSVFRNRILNGDMRIDQRNAGAAVTHSGVSNMYGMDRMVFNSNGTPQFSVQQVSDAPTGFSYSAKLTTTTSGTPAATDFSYFGQYIEGYNVADLAFGTASAATVTLSFWVKSSLTGTFGGGLLNSAVNRSYVFSYTINAANTWEKKSITIAGDTTGTWLTTNGIGIEVLFDTGAGANNKAAAGSWVASAKQGVTSGVNLVASSSATWYVTGIQLEKGSTATSFDVRPYGTELNLCQRYLYVVSVDTNFNYFGQAFSTTAASATVPLPVQPRVAPTGITTSGTIVMTTSNGSSSGGTLAFKSSTLDHCTVGITGGSGLTAGYSSSLISTSGTQSIQFTGCEL
jgi:hypothetical protein